MKYIKKGKLSGLCLIVTEGEGFLLEATQPTHTLAQGAGGGQPHPHYTHTRKQQHSKEVGNIGGKKPDQEGELILNRTVLCVPQICTSDVECLMSRLQHTFKQEMTGVGASLEKRWKFCGFEGLKLT